jgi:hypothetical protein
MQPQNQFLSFLVELAQRIRTKKPKFFVVLQWLTGVLAGVTGIPSFLAQFNIVLPPAMTALENKYVAWAAIGFSLASQLTAAPPAATVTADGTVLTATDEKKMPFTTKVEVKKAQDAEIPNSSSTLAEIKK